MSNQATLKRGISTEFGTFGELTSGGFLLKILERPKEGDHPCIPEGTYKCTWFNSPHNGWCYLLHDVPGRSMIEIHSANTSNQLLGCLAPGLKLGTIDDIPAVLQSKEALNLLHTTFGEEFILTIC